MDKGFLDDEPLAKAPFLITAGDRQWLFYLCRGSLGLQGRENQDWEEPRILRPQVEKFAAALDASANTHLVVLSGGDLYHLTALTEKENRPSEKMIFQEGERTCSNLLLTGDPEGGLHLLYSARDPGTDRWWLFHHLFDGKQWLEPRVIDFGGSAPGSPGCLAAERKGDLHLVYKIGEGDESRLYYRRFLADSLSWDRAFPVSAYGRPRLPGLLVDKEGNLHLIWCSQQDGSYLINYRKLLAGGWPSGGWGEIETLSPPLASLPLPLLNCREEKINAGWFLDKKLWQQELTAQGWQEGISGQEIPDCLVINSCSSAGRELPPATARILGQGPPPNSALVPATAPSRPGWEPYFQQLDTYSKGLIHRAAGLTAAKGELKRALEAKEKEMFWISQHSQQKIGTLTGSLQQKNRELEELEGKLQQAIASLKEKTERSHRQWAEEKKRYQQKNRELEKESRQLQQMLLEKERTIAGIETQLQELKENIARIKEENRSLQHRMEQPLPRIREWLGRIFQSKP